MFTHSQYILAASSVFMHRSPRCATASGLCVPIPTFSFRECQSQEPPEGLALIAEEED